MKREIRLCGLDMATPSMFTHGSWRRPGDTGLDYMKLDYWLDYARLLEKGLFDALFLADVYGAYDVYGDSQDTAVKWGTHIPAIDPISTIPAMAAVTSDLAFAVTSNLTYEPPYLFARRMASLDHLTGGRIGWNVVTGILKSSAKAMGQTLRGHDIRYDVADEYMQVMYKLWESSWEQGAILKDKATGVYADPSKVHKITHEGDYFQMEGVQLCEPSPQRTPVLFQAGASPRGRAFAADHAEIVFVNGTSKKKVAEVVADIRSRAKAIGRDPQGIRFLLGTCVITGTSAEDAARKIETYASYTNDEAILAHLSAGIGIDLAKYSFDEPIRYEENDANRSVLENLTRGADRVRTLREIVQEMAVAAKSVLIAGTAAAICDELESWMETGIDGFLIARVAHPETLSDFVDLVVPELQNRGLYKTRYQPGTFRQKLGLSDDGHLASDHVGATYRKAPEPLRATA